MAAAGSESRDGGGLVVAGRKIDVIDAVPYIHSLTMINYKL